MGRLRDELLEILNEPGSQDEELRRRIVEALLVSTPQEKLTYQEFLSWADEDTLAEWVDGKVVMATPASKRHQEIAGFLHSIVQVYAEFHQLGIVLPPPFQMRLERSGREPDLIFIAEAHLDRLQDTYLDGPADLVVEIISPESLGRDRGEKFAEYEQAGIPEYWLIDPTRQQAEFYQLDDQGLYRVILSDEEGIYRSRILGGFWLREKWLWNTPSFIETFRALGLV